MNIENVSIFEDDVGELVRDRECQGTAQYTLVIRSLAGFQESEVIRVPSLSLPLHIDPFEAGMARYNRQSPFRCRVDLLRHST